jgi:hypothetical protein
VVLTFRTQRQPAGFSAFRAGVRRSSPHFSHKE